MTDNVSKRWKLARPPPLQTRTANVERNQLVGASPVAAWSDVTAVLFQEI